MQISFSGLDITRKEMSILGSRASANSFPEALELLASGAVRYPQLASVFDLNLAPEVFERLAKNKGSIHKAVLVPQHF
jgi:L-gulonate 5-dehydrogenase